MLGRKRIAIVDRRTAFAVTVLLSAACAGTCPPANDATAGEPAHRTDQPKSKRATHEDALKLIEALGGRYSPPPQERKEAGAAVVLSATDVSDDQLRIIAGVNDLAHLGLARTGITDDGLSIVAQEMPNLRTIYLAGTRITGEGLRQLRQMDHLERLSVSGTSIRESDLAALAGMKRLTTISPFAETTTKAWLITDELQSTPWVTSADGVLSTRLLSPKAPMRPDARLILVVELCNNSRKAIQVLRLLFGCPYPDISVLGPSGSLPFRGVHSDYATSRSMFIVIPPGDSIRHRVEVGASDYLGFDKAGKYRVVFTYTVKEWYRGIASSSGIDESQLWIGKIISAPLTITKETEAK